MLFSISLPDISLTNFFLNQIRLQNTKIINVDKRVKLLLTSSSNPYTKYVFLVKLNYALGLVICIN